MDLFSGGRSEDFVKRTGAVVVTGGQRALYQIDHDQIKMPDRTSFKSTSTSTATEAYYSTLFHELVHWSGARDRCGRLFGSLIEEEVYAREELVAELGAAFLCSRLEVTLVPRLDHAKYISYWLKILRSEPSALMKAATAASNAVDFLESIALDQSGSDHQ